MDTRLGVIVEVIVAFLGSAILGFSMVSATPANASNWSGATGVGGCYVIKADSAEHGFYYSWLTSGTAAAMDWSRTNVVNPTKINTWFDGNNAQTDVIVVDAYYGGSICGTTWYTDTSNRGIVGLAYCESLSGSSCEQFTVYVNLSWSEDQAPDHVQALASHEIGHTIGLEHRYSGNTAMRRGYPKASRYYDAHDWGHLNANY